MVANGGEPKIVDWLQNTPSSITCRTPIAMSVSTAAAKSKSVDSFVTGESRASCCHPALLDAQRVLPHVVEWCRAFLLASRQNSLNTLSDEYYGGELDLHSRPASYNMGDSPGCKTPCTG